MRAAIAAGERVDEIRPLSDKAMALRAYFAQSRDVDNEVAAMRIRLRAERRLGELIEQEQEAGRLATKGETKQPGRMSTPTTFAELGIPRDRSARAQELARVPEAQFEAALHQPKPSARSIAALAPARGAPSQRAQSIELLLPGTLHHLQMLRHSLIVVVPLPIPDDEKSCLHRLALVRAHFNRYVEMARAVVLARQ